MNRRTNTPDQRSLYEQLVSLQRMTNRADITDPNKVWEYEDAHALIVLANRNGLYDAADYLWLRLEASK